MDMEWKVAGQTILNQVVVAPMAGITNPAYRRILKECGAGLIYTEMVSDKGLGHENEKTFSMLTVMPDEHPIVLQLFGSDPESMAVAAGIVTNETDADIIDINMGCPVTKVVKNGAGAKLMLDIEKASAIVRAVVSVTNKPVSVKIRSGWDKEHLNAPSFAKALEESGASMIAVHARTKTEMYGGKADWDVIRQVKEKVNIPVVGNGDIRKPEDAEHMLKQTGCDAVMIGRGLLGNPWLVSQTVEYLEAGTYDPHVTLEKRKEMIYRHFGLLRDLKGERSAILEMRSHGPWYLRGLKNSAQIKARLSQTRTEKEFSLVIEEYFDYLYSL